MEERNDQVTEELMEDQETEASEAMAADEADQAALFETTIAELQTKLAETENRMLRLQADFDNYRRRVQLDRQAAEMYRAQSLVSDLLPALDNFERAMKIEAHDETSQSLLQGMQMVYRQMTEALQKEGVEAIEAVGQPFDPNYHQAIMQVEDSGCESNTVVEEFQKGYKLKDRVIRPSMVKVSQ